MKTLKQVFIVASLIVISHFAVGQSFTVPEDYTLKEVSDFTKYEKDVIDCVTWLENTPVDEQKSKRSEANKFLIQWASGSPNITISINSNIVNFSDKNPVLLVIFMGGWVKYALENPDYKDDEVKCNLAGLRSVIKVYEKGNGMKKDRNVEKLIKLEKKGKLEEWVKQHLKK